MVKPTSTPLPNPPYRDAHGQMVSVTAVAHNRVTFYRQGYQFPGSHYGLIYPRREAITPGSA